MFCSKVALFLVSDADVQIPYAQWNMENALDLGWGGESDLTIRNHLITLPYISIMYLIIYLNTYTYMTYNI